MMFHPRETPCPSHLPSGSVWVQKNRTINRGIRYSVESGGFVSLSPQVPQLDVRSFKYHHLSF